MSWPTGKPRSEATKKKISESCKGKPTWCAGKKLSIETKKKMSAAHIGKTHTPESKHKMSITKIGKKFSQEHRNNLSKSQKGRLSPWKGMRHNEESKQKISEAGRGRICSVETREKLSKSWTPNPKRGYSKKGHHHGILYDSSFELNFMKLLDEYKIPYERADNKNFRVKYIFENQEHYYYPDFYLPREGSIVEIKPFYKLNDLRTQAKLNSAKMIYGEKFLILTEKDLPILLLNET